MLVARLGLSASISGRGSSATRPVLDLNFLSGALDSRLTLTRASTAMAFSSAGTLTSYAVDVPRFDYDPLTVKTNLALRSSEQDNAGVWTAAQVTVSANTVTAPDSALTGDTLTENSTSLSRGTVQSIAIATNVAQTFSVYAKAGTRSWLRLMLNTGSDSVICWFNLGGGAVGSTALEGTGSSASGAITDAGNGWYRCALTGIPSSANSGTIGAFIRMATGDAEYSYQGNGNGTLHLWGAQLEVGSSASAYIPTTSAAASTATARGLLLEESRTNIALRSAELDNAVWTKAASTVTANAVTAPDGTVTADRVVETAATSNHTLRQVITMSATTYTATIFAKIGERNTFTMAASDSGAALFRTAHFNLLAGTTSNGSTGLAGSSAITSVGNGWYRCSMTFTTTVGGAASYFDVRLSDSTTPASFGASYLGDINSGMYFWGGQLEVGAFATSYIPTAAASATRAVDVCSSLVSGFAFNAVEGTLLAAFTPLGVTGLQTAVYLEDGTNNERMGARASSGAMAGVVVDGGVSQASANAGTLTAVASKVAFAYKVDDIAVCLNGGTVGTDALATLPTVTKLQIGSRLTGSEVLSGWYTRVSCYGRRLDNATLIRITT